MKLSPGEASDTKGYGPVMDEPGPVRKVLTADEDYDSDAIRDDLTARGVTAVIRTSGTGRSKNRSTAPSRRPVRRCPGQ